LDHSTKQIYETVKIDKIRAKMDLLERIDELLADPLHDMGYRTVRLTFGGEGRLRSLQILAERLDDVPISIGDCAEISRTAAALLDVEDWITGQYNLEVSSAGMARPLTRHEDYGRFKGRVAKIELDSPINGGESRRRFKGTILGLDDDGNISFAQDDEGETYTIPFAAIQKAKLVVTDEMIMQAQRDSKKRDAKDSKQKEKQEQKK